MNFLGATARNDLSLFQKRVVLHTNCLAYFAHPTPLPDEDCNAELPAFMCTESTCRKPGTDSAYGKRERPLA
jgi:hypothetical protein